MKKKPLTNKQFVANKQAAINKKRMGESIGQTAEAMGYGKPKPGQKVKKMERIRNQK